MAWSIFEGKKNKMLGIDVGTSSIKIVELTKSGDKIELSNYGEFVETNGVLQTSSLKLLSERAAEIIRDILNEAGVKERKAAMSVPMFSGFSTVITMPNMAEQELNQAVIYEAKKYIPLPLSEVKFEWSKITSGNNKIGQVDLMIVAVTNELINRYQEIARLSELDLRYVELDAFSLARALIDEGEAPSMIIDIGSRSTTMLVTENDWPMHTRTLEIAGLAFTKLLANSIGVDMKRAESLKYKAGISAAGGVILPMIDSMLMEARRMIDDYAKTRKSAIQKVVLSGGSVSMPGFFEYVVKSLGKETVIANPFRDIIYEEVLKSTINKTGPSFSVAVGLALREFKESS